MERPYCCARCGEPHIVLRRIIIANGTIQIRWICPECNGDAENPPRSLRHMEVAQFLKGWEKTLADIPVFADYSDRQPCAICGNPGEYHHWAPKAMSADFGDDWPKWPQSPLCIKHHNQWRDIVTPQLKGG